MKYELAKLIHIDGVAIGPGQPTYIIAEMSANHGQDYQRAVDIVVEAKKAGANAIKLQTYTPDTLTLNSDRPEFYIDSGPWRGQTMYELYQDAYMPWEWHESLKRVAAEVGITIFSTPFDYSAVSLLKSLDFPAYKIASPELIDLDLIREVAATGKPVIMSTGSGTLEEIRQAVSVFCEAGNTQLCLLKCTSSYPAPFEAMNIRTIKHMKGLFSCPVGLSDHSLGLVVPTISVAFGANVIEKHFTLSKKDETADNFFSLDFNEFAEMVTAVRQAELAIGEVVYPEESDSGRRSLYVTASIKAGERFSQQNIRNLRPGRGIPPRFLRDVLGRSASRDIESGEALYWDMISK